MLACVHAEDPLANLCPYDDGRTICSETWEIRQLYVVEATARPQLTTQRFGSAGLLIPKRVFYIDSEGWFITASDQYDQNGSLWKTIVAFSTDSYQSSKSRTRMLCGRLLTTALVDEDVQTGFSSIMFTPGSESMNPKDHLVSAGTITKEFLDLYQLEWQKYGAR
jgi:Protein of unknown function (DUF1329)